MQLIVSFYDRRQFAGHPKQFLTLFFFSLRLTCLSSSIRCAMIILVQSRIPIHLMTWIKKTVYMFSSMLPSERRAKVVCSTCRKYEAKEKKQHHCRLQSRCHRECLVAAAGAGWCRCVANYPNDFLLRRFVCASFILLRVSLFGVSILLSALSIVHVVCGIHQHGYLSSLLFFFCHRQR